MTVFMDFFSLDNGLLPLESKIQRDAYCSIDLSETNPVLDTINITLPEECQQYIDTVLKQNKAKVAYGGYLEKRKLYAAERFSNGPQRNIHLGVDFWCSAGTEVIAPLDGVVHSFNNNSDTGNYGPTIILEHKIKGETFHTLYGHLALESLEGLSLGKPFSKGDVLATLGTTDINVNYAPHLHFQVIKDMQGYSGDYPGVCSEVDLDYFKENCPDPNLFLKL